MTNFKKTWLFISLSEINFILNMSKTRQSTSNKFNFRTAGSKRRSTTVGYPLSYKKNLPKSCNLTEFVPLCYKKCNITEQRHHFCNITENWLFDLQFRRKLLLALSLSLSKPQFDVNKYFLQLYSSYLPFLRYVWRNAVNLSSHRYVISKCILNLSRSG